MFKRALFVMTLMLGTLIGTSLTYYAILRTEEEPIIAFARWPCIALFHMGAAFIVAVLPWFFPRIFVSCSSDKELAEFAEALSREVDRRTQ